MIGEFFVVNNAILGRLSSVPQHLIERQTRLVNKVLPEFSPAARQILHFGLEQALLELDNLDRNQTFNVSASFSLSSGSFEATDLEGKLLSTGSSLMQKDLIFSCMIDSESLTDIARQIRLGHIHVLAYETLTPYLRNGGEPSVDALARRLLDEAVRVVGLGLPVTHEIHRLLDAYHAT